MDGRINRSAPCTASKRSKPRWGVNSICTRAGRGRDAKMRPTPNSNAIVTNQLVPQAKNASVHHLDTIATARGFIKELFDHSISCWGR